MPRPILGTPQPRVHTSPSAVTPRRSTLTSVQLQQRLRQKRTVGYVHSMKRIDVGTHIPSRAAMEELIDVISGEFPDLGIDERPIGIVSRCYLGAPYEAHICDMAGEIIEHFETFRPMPPLYERARSLAGHPSYAFIEIYNDVLRAVSVDGDVSVIDK